MTDRQLADAAIAAAKATTISSRPGPKPTPAIHRLLTKISGNASSEGCLVWTGGQSGNGYGHFYYDGRLIRAHRAAYLIFVGPIPVDRELDHLCRNTLCVNPFHLEAVTHRENCKRGGNARLTEACKQGHPWTEETTSYAYDATRDRIFRTCKTCAKRRDAARTRKSAAQ